MIQRIQSLYLLLLTGVLVILYFMPFARFIGGTEEYFINVFGIYATTPVTQLVVPTIQMLTVLVLSTLLPFVTIFLYRRRRLQIRLCIVEMVLLLGLQVFIGYYMFRTGSVMSALANFSKEYSIAAVIPLVGIILAYLAYRGVIRDEALLRSADRIR